MPQGFGGPKPDDFGLVRHLYGTCLSPSVLLLIFFQQLLSRIRSHIFLIRAIGFLWLGHPQKAFTQKRVNVLILELRPVRSLKLAQNIRNTLRLRAIIQEIFYFIPT